MSKHTRGPWRAEGWKGVVVNDPDGNTLALFPAGDRKLETAQANARLIAAAPELLEALKACAYALSRHSKDDCFAADAEFDAAAAIAKATNAPQD